MDLLAFMRFLLRLLNENARVSGKYYLYQANIHLL
jgi:hypothetical protein